MKLRSHKQRVSKVKRHARRRHKPLARYVVGEVKLERARENWREVFRQRARSNGFTT